MSDAEAILRTYPWLGAPTDGSRLIAEENRFRATGDDRTYPVVQGIPHLFTPGRPAMTDTLAPRESAKYPTKRDPDKLDLTVLRMLPYATMPEEGPATWVRKKEAWEILQRFLSRAHDAGTFPAAPRVVDAGTGTGWLARRLSLTGAYVIALDVSLDRRFGLGAAVQIAGDVQAPFLPVRADFAFPPIRTGTADLIVYAESVADAATLPQTLMRGAQTLADEGLLVIMDTPIADQPPGMEQAEMLTHAVVEDALHTAQLTVREWYEPAQIAARLVRRFTQRRNARTSDAPYPFIVATRRLS